MKFIGVHRAWHDLTCVYCGSLVAVTWSVNHGAGSLLGDAAVVQARGDGGSPQNGWSARSQKGRWAMLGREGEQGLPTVWLTAGEKSQAERSCWKDCSRRRVQVEWKGKAENSVLDTSAVPCSFLSFLDLHAGLSSSRLNI